MDFFVCCDSETSVAPYYFNCFASKCAVQCRTKPAVLCELSLQRFKTTKLCGIKVTN
jgi:hypothetical protein